MRKHLVSQLAHVELLTPKPDETVWFFTELLGLQESHREGQSVYLRAYGDRFHHSMKVTESREPGLGHGAWRTDDEDTLEQAARALEAAGLGDGWTDGDVGHGRAYRYRTPDGHVSELFWEVDWFEPSEEERSPIKCRPQKYPLRGAPARRIDHLTLMTSDVTACRTAYEDILGFRTHERIMMPGDVGEIGAWMSVTNLNHDTAFVLDQSGAKGRLNHVAYWMDSREEVMRCADIIKDHGVFLEAGPSRHGISEAFFMYVYEPGGNRIEVYNGGYLSFAPDWGPVDWYPHENPPMAWAGELPPSLFAYGTPVVEMPEQSPDDAVPVGAPAS